jgi:hypothetical protein
VRMGVSEGMENSQGAAQGTVSAGCWHCG